MAAVFILAGGLVGFASAIASLVFLDASFALALGIWSGAGIAAFALGLAVSMVTSRPARTQNDEAPASARTI